ncbi:peptidylprolyl isomerase SurA [Psychromonas sp. MME2]|uniref:peptidylprolyl isomerase SurA n=1 Tax=Psychromonas sp. MME2 TaxID=3231033 RepID=UPI00339D2ACF
MKIIKNLALALSCSILTIPAVLAKEVQVDRIEAIVNQEVILESDVKRMRLSVHKHYKNEQAAMPSDQELQKQIIDKLIDDRLQLQIAERIGLRINDAQLDQTIQEITKEQGLTVAQLQAKLEKEGESYSAFVDDVRQELTINEVRQMQVRRRINISDQEVNQMVEKLNEHGEKNTQFKFVHIMLRMSSNASVEEEKTLTKQANELISRIKNGEDMSNLAVKYSQGPRALEGGHWDWRTINEIPTLFADSFDDIKTKKGNIIGPIRSNMGLHIIEVVDKKGSSNVITTEVNARHILIKSNIILSDEKAKELLTQYRQEIIDGKASFAQLAREYSQDPGSAIKGGDLGWSNPSMYVPEFRDLALSLPIDKISQPFKTMHGWHILEVMNRRDSDTTEQATKQKAYSIIYRQRFPAEAAVWLNELREEAYIKIMDPDYMIKAVK